MLILSVIAQLCVIDASRAHSEPAASVLARSDAPKALDLSQLADAPTQIVETRSVAPAEKIPGYCEVSGYVVPRFGFLLRLPSENWNGKFLALGCGGFGSGAS